MSPELRLVLIILALLAAAWLGAKLAALWRRFWMARRFARGRTGEHDAKGVLESLGYRILQSQASRQVPVLVDGKPQMAEVIADYLTAKNGRACLIEVKTGAQAVDPLYAPTRRQLLEYTLAFPDYTLFLLDMEARALKRIEFPCAGKEPSWCRHLPWLLAGLGLGIAIGIGIGACLG